MAEQLDMNSSSYVRYEDPNRFKKRFLPIELTARIARVLERRGIEHQETMRLAGVEETGDGPRYGLRETLSVEEEELLNAYRLLAPQCRGALQIIVAHLDSKDTPPIALQLLAPSVEQTLHDNGQSFRHEPA